MTLRTFVTLLGKVDVADHRPRERTRFNEKLYPDACMQDYQVVSLACVLVFALKEHSLTFGEEAAELIAASSGHSWSEERVLLSSFLLCTAHTQVSAVTALLCVCVCLLAV